MNFRLALLIFFFTFLKIIAAAQIYDIESLDHKKMITELNQSQEHFYYVILERYQQHLTDHPDDISILIELCEYVQNAVYDEYEDNPNQVYFDSCSASLLERYPNNPEVLLYHLRITCGDERTEILDQSLASVEDGIDQWSDENLGILYSGLAEDNYDDLDYDQALFYMEEACNNDDQYKVSLNYARILIELEKNDEAITVINDGVDSAKGAWDISQRADLLLLLEEYSAALELYELINIIDSSYTNNKELAETMEGIGEFEKARKLRVADTSYYWDKKGSALRLLQHDIKFQPGDSCIKSYNGYREHGYSSDPMALYRLRLFFSHPFLAWKFRDLLGLLTLLLVLTLLILMPSIWILPVYFIGHKWKYIRHVSPEKLDWGLKSFWWVSAGYLLASFAALLMEPNYLNSFINWSDSDYLLTPEELGFSTMVFILAYAAFGLSTIYGVSLNNWHPRHWTIGKCITRGIGWFIIFKFLSGFYAIAVNAVDHVSLDDFSVNLDLFLSSREDIEAILTTYGKGVAFLVITLLVPIYEEVIFRGVILGSCSRYLPFKWANILQAGLFAAIHQDLVLFPVFFLFAILTGILAKRSGSLLGGIVFHVINNFLALVALMVRINTGG